MIEDDGFKKPADSSESSPAGNVKEIRPADYLRLAKAHLRSGERKAAFAVLQQATVHFPDDPVILSYYGYLQALVDKRHRSGVETCKKAIALLTAKTSFSEESLYPVFYLNLGRTYLAAGKKKDALDAFNKGLKYDNGNSELRKEVRGLGQRKKPPVAFLERSNPINKYIGKVLQGEKREPEKSGDRR